MNRLGVFLILILTAATSFLHLSAQFVTWDISFDNYISSANNDFVNFFNGGNGLTQIQTNGITGGCLNTPDSISWGNDNAIYCAKYKASVGTTAVTSISFKYDTSLLDQPSYERAVSVWLRPWTEFNHYIIAGVAKNKRIELLTYAWTNNPGPVLALVDGHWYNFELTVTFDNLSEVELSAAVFDLGTTGTSNPVLLDSDGGTISDNVFAVDTLIEVSITGTHYGGALYLDNVHYEGIKSDDNCPVITAIDEGSEFSIIHLFPNPATDQLQIKFPSTEKGILQLVNMNGQVIYCAEFSNTTHIVGDLKDYPVGMYLVTWNNGSELLSGKIVIEANQK